MPLENYVSVDNFTGLFFQTCFGFINAGSEMQLYRIAIVKGKKESTQA